MTTVWYTSDLHIGHPLVAQMRTGIDDPDLAIETHDALLAANWDARVGKRDLVWIAGDLCVGGLDAALAWVEKRPGEKRITFGNHDPGHPANVKSASKLKDYYRVFTYAQPYAQVKIAGEKVLISHFPYTGDRGEDRWTQFRVPDEGKKLLHGHMHSEEKIIDPSKPYQIHIGVDAWDLCPVSIDEVRVLLRKADEYALVHPTATHN